MRPTDVKKARAVAQKAEEQRRMTIGRITFIKKTHCLFLNFMVEMPGTDWVGWDGKKSARGVYRALGPGGAKNVSLSILKSNVPFGNCGK